VRVVLRTAEDPLDLVEAGLDAHIVARPPAWPTVRVRRLGTVARELWSHPDLAPTSLETLRETPAVLHAAERSWTLRTPQGPVEIQPHPRLRVDADAALLAALYGGGGVGAVPPGPHPGLVRVLPASSLQDEVLYAVTPRAGRRSLAVEALLALPLMSGE
jgi:hypothetical protein